ncbi:MULTISPECIES: hypothetical protein [Enterobacter]|nr:MULTISPECIES: hypothetical protein [Enterobacter]MEA3784808.1 hypothetical protein [Enterobacter quasihormaechei]MEA3871275.1 hypothetical protein [Enterobacter quasihormaechei]
MRLQRTQPAGRRAQPVRRGLYVAPLVKTPDPLELAVQFSAQSEL